MVQTLPVDNKVSMTVSEVRADLSIDLAGRASEEVFFGPNKITTGAENDIMQATRTARYAITTAGLSPKIGMVAINQLDTFGQRTALENASEKTAQAVDAEVRKWIDNAYKDAKSLISKNKATVERIAKALLDKETLSADEIRDIIANKKTVAKKTTKKSNAKK